MSEKAIKLSEATARKLYPTAAPELRTILEENFTKETLQQSIFDRVKTMEDVFREAGECAADYVVPSIPEGVEEGSREYRLLMRDISRIRHARWDLVNEVFREGKELTLHDEWWYNWMYRPTDRNNSGSGWSLFVSLYDVDFALVGSRLCCRDKITAQHLDKYFRDEHTAYLENRPGS